MEQNLLPNTENPSISQSDRDDNTILGKAFFWALLLMSLVTLGFGLFNAVCLA